jgi:hypothetical protein
MSTWPLSIVDARDATARAWEEPLDVTDGQELLV